MVADRTLYDVLGVEPNATQEQIKEAARAKSLEHHPDRGGSHEKMQQVNAAKTILSDPEKRRTYDRIGLKGMQSGMSDTDSPFDGFPGGGIFDLLNMFTRRQRPTVRKGSDIKQSLKVSLEELYLGSTKAIPVTRQVVCTNCKGTGSRDGKSQECHNCDGTGIETLIQRFGPMIQQSQGPCSLCHGTGTRIESSNRCKTCNGQKYSRQTKDIEVNLVHGSEDGETIKFNGEGNQITNGESGNLFIILDQQPHPLFQRKGDHLVMRLQINLTESLCGFQRVIPLLDGQKILIDHPYGKPIAPGNFRSLPGYGMPNRHTHSHGDLIIHFDVTFPDEKFITNEKQRRQLEALLPPKKHVKLDNTSNYVQPEMIECGHPSYHDHQHGRRGHHHHDREEEHDHFDEQPQGIGCPTQ